MKPLKDLMFEILVNGSLFLECAQAAWLPIRSPHDLRLMVVNIEQH